MKKTDQNDVLQKVFCNQCGREMKVEAGILKEGCFGAEAVFGYFSEHDGEKVSFDLCEVCFEKMIAQFAIPANREAVKEYL